MTLPAFTPPVAPSPGSSHSPEITLNQASFGDGYSAASPNGLNHVRQIVSLRWSGLTLDQMAAIRDFLEERGGYRAFLYQPYGFAVPYRWTCAEWSFGAGPPWAAEAKLRQSFRLDD